MTKPTELENQISNNDNPKSEEKRQPLENVGSPVSPPHNKG